MTIKKISKIYTVIKELEKIARKLQKINELYCLQDLTKRQINREIALEKKAKVLANEIGLRAIHQHDPRGGALFLVEKGKKMRPEEYTKMLYLHY